MPLLRSTRMSALLIVGLALAVYALTSLEFADRRLAGDGELFVGVVALTVLIWTLFIHGERMTTWLLWGAVVPVVASSAAYLAVLVKFYLRHGHIQPDQSLLAWVPTVIVFPYIGCRVWLLSLLLVSFGAAYSFMLVRSMGSNSAKL